MNGKTNESHLFIEVNEWTRLNDLPAISDRLMESACGGQGVCGKCRIRVIQGKSSTPSVEEQEYLSAAELQDGLRLACYCTVKGRIHIGLPAVEEINDSGAEKTNRPENPYYFHQSKKGPYGIALDLGTTTLAARLLDLETGKVIAEDARLNPQYVLGADILSRVYAAKNPGGSERLQSMLHQGLEQMLADLMNRVNIQKSDVKSMVIAGNTIMQHLLMGINPASLGSFPYSPVFNGGWITGHNQSFIMAPDAKTYIIPSASGFIGGDIIGGVAYLGLNRTEKTSLFIDLGTNGEIVLSHDRALRACSVAAGPALEGMNIECGIRAGNGAIEKVWMGRSGLDYQVVGKGKPRGLCGSGILDLLKVLRNEGIVSTSGRFLNHDRVNRMVVAPSLIDNLVKTDGKNRFYLVPSVNGERGIYLSQNDIRQVQLVKGALCAGIEILLESAGIAMEEVQRVLLAGALGNYSSPDSLLELGFFPLVWADRLEMAGNTALSGASAILLSNDTIEQFEELLHDMICLDLSNHINFQDLFLKGMSLEQQ